MPSPQSRPPGNCAGAGKKQSVHPKPAGTARHGSGFRAAPGVKKHSPLTKLLRPSSCLERICFFFRLICLCCFATGVADARAPTRCQKSQLTIKFIHNDFNQNPRLRRAGFGWWDGGTMEPWVVGFGAFCHLGNPEPPSAFHGPMQTRAFR